MAEPASTAQDAERLDDALYVLHGSQGTGTIRALLYGGYLVAIFGGVYGFNLLRALLISSDPQWLRAAAASVWSLLAFGTLIIGLGLLAWRVGRVRGPLVPPLPFIDLLLGSAIDRWQVLRERAWVLLISGLGVGVLIGVLLGGAAMGAGLGSAAAVLGAVVGGAVLGVALAWLWLAGQHSLAPRGPGRAVNWPAMVRDLRLDDVRAHALRTTHIGGAVLAGDLRAARLDVAPAITRARSRRLRPGGRVSTIVRRDILGYRRAPGQAVAGVLGVGVSSALIALAVLQPAAPRILGALALIVAYLGFGALAEGVRLVADNAGTPPLLGVSFRAEAVLHLIAPAALALACALPIAALVGRAHALEAAGAPGLHPAYALGAVTVMVALLAGVTLMAAFRGTPPEMSFVPEVGPMTMAYWYGRPLAVAVSGGLLLGSLADSRGWAPVLLGAELALAVAIIAYGIRLARRLELGHRG